MISMMQNSKTIDGSSPSTILEESIGFEATDRFILESCGYNVDSPRGRMIYEGIVAKNDDEKIFTIDKYRSYNLDDATDEVLKDESFDNFWHKNIYDKLDDEADGTLLEQWTPDFMREEVRKHLNGLNKLELFYYIDFFRDILSKSENTDALEILDFNDKSFDDMPKVMRLY